MHLQEHLIHTLERTPADLSRLCELIDPQWINQALAATGKASIRKRKLPAEQAVWLVIGLALFRNQPIWHVVRQLDLCLGQDEQVAPSATVQARQRLGSEPMAQLFGQITHAWGHQTPSPAHLGLRQLAVDGIVWATPDTPENRQALGRERDSQYGAGAWPQIRAVCLMDTHSHELLDACMGGMDQGELTLAASLKAPDDSLTVFDRAYFSAAHLLAWQAQGQQRHWLMRARDNLRYEVLSTNGCGDQHISMPISPRARKLHPHLPATWQARLIEVEIAGKKRRFITSLLDAQRYSAKELAARYCQRWEIELGFREIKQSLQGSAPVLRSKQPDLVRQELWGVLIAYTLIRRLMRLMAQTINIAPQRIGFHVATIAIIEILRFAPLETAGTLPRRLATLFEQAHLFVLPPRRTDRSFARAVKRRVAKYPVKMPVSA